MGNVQDLQLHDSGCDLQLERGYVTTLGILFAHIFSVTKPVFSINENENEDKTITKLKR